MGPPLSPWAFFSAVMLIVHPAPHSASRRAAAEQPPSMDLAG